MVRKMQSRTAGLPLAFTSRNFYSELSLPEVDFKSEFCQNICLKLQFSCYFVGITGLPQNNDASAIKVIKNVN